MQLEESSHLYNYLDVKTGFYQNFIEESHRTTSINFCMQVISMQLAVNQFRVLLTKQLK